MRALIIAPQPFFSPRGTPFSVYYRSLVTSELGVEADLLTYGEGQDVDIPGLRIVRIPRFAWLGNVKTGPSWLKLFLDLFVIVWAVALLLRRRYDVVHAHEEAVFFCRYLKPLFRFRLIYDMHSSLPQQLTNFNFTSSRLIYRIFKWQEDGAIAKADAVITICPDLADYVLDMIGDRDKHVLIENSIFDPVRISRHSEPAPDAAPTDRDGPDSLPAGRKFLVYAGTLEHYQGIGILIRAFREVLETSPDAFLVVVGGTPGQVEQYAALARELGLASSSRFTGRLPQAAANAYLDRAAVLLSPRSEGTNTPLKIYQQLASGVPLVATNIYSHTQVLDDTVAVLVDPEPASMARGILQVLTDDAAAARAAANARQLYDEKYSRKAYVTKMHQLFKILNREQGSDQAK